MNEELIRTVFERLCDLVVRGSEQTGLFLLDAFSLESDEGVMMVFVLDKGVLLCQMGWAYFAPRCLEDHAPLTLDEAITAVQQIREWNIR
ncbi:MAG: hypothetical protein Q8O95_03045 [bacterium]|nr:hypothetical protein [bacterium]